MDKNFIKAFLSKSVEKMEDEFKKIGVSLRDNKGNFRNTYDVLKELSDVFTKSH